MYRFSARFDHDQTPTPKQCESMLQQHVLDVWFPRSLDFEYGGFLCDFDRTWKPCGPHEKLLEFQARQTLLAAEASRVYPKDERLRQASLHGFRYLRDTMWDRDSGGWFHRLDRAGRPLEAHTKHAHGAAYAIAACVAVHEITGEPGALDLAREGFEWLEGCAHDHQHGGYFGFLKKDGMVIRKESDCPWKAAIDTIDTPIGLKDANVHSDLVETFCYLYRVWPDPKLVERLAEVVEILCEKILSPSGAYFFLHPDWTPVPHLVRFGYEFLAAYRLMLARRLVGSKERINAVACRSVDHALRYGWDHRAGGFFYAGPGSAPTRIEGHPLMVRRKPWWVQSEALKGLLSIRQLEPENVNYRRSFAAQWNYMVRFLFDFRYGGTYSVGLDILPGWLSRLGASFAPAKFTRKGSLWKDGSHDGRALLYVISTLRDGSGSAECSPLAPGGAVRR